MARTEFVGLTFWPLRTANATSENRRRLARCLQEQGLHNARYAGSVATEQAPCREPATGTSACA